MMGRYNTKQHNIVCWTGALIMNEYANQEMFGPSTTTTGSRAPDIRAVAAMLHRTL